MSDAAILQAIVGLRAPGLDELMIAASAAGSAGFLWLVIAAVGALHPARRAAAWRLLLALLLATVVVDAALKPLVARPRPSDVLPDLTLLDARPTTASFPSGHAARALAGALAAGPLFPRLQWLWWALAGLIAVSRVYLGVHWPTDVAAGAAAGWLCGWLVLGGAGEGHRQPAERRGRPG